MKLKYLSQFRYGDALATDAKKSGDVAVYGSNGQIDVHSQANFLSPGIVIGRKGSYGKLTWASNGGFCIDTAYFIDRTCTCANLRYVYYMLHTLKLDVGSRDSAVPGLDRQIAHDKTVHQHDLHTQKLIADFLDRKTTQIDQAIKTREQQITLLNEYRQIIIQNAVTKGLDSSVPLKSSGVQWIGHIPCHWNIERIKYGLKEKKFLKNNNLPSGSISYGEVILKNSDKIPLQTRESYQEVLSGEYLINPINLNYDLISLRTALSNHDVCVSPAYIVLIGMPEKITPSFGKYILYTFDVQHMKSLGGGIRQTINFKDIGECLWALPPLHEQTAIATFLDTKTASIYQAIEIKTRQIAALKEYRATLINAAVTGKLDTT